MTRERRHLRRSGPKGNPTPWLKELEEKGNKAADEIADLAIRQNAVLEEVLRGVTSPNKRVKSAKRFIHKKNLRVSSQSPCQPYPLLHTAAQFMHLALSPAF